MLIRIAFLTTIAALASCGSSPQPESRLITINKDQFSAVYPAVWFSPSSGEIVGLTSQSEQAPSDEFEIWIEPGDPEFSISKELTKYPENSFGFLRIGNGVEIFDRAFNLPQSERGEVVGRLGGELETDDHPVILYVGKKSNCVIMIEEIDTDKEIIRFRWMPLNK